MNDLSTPQKQFNINRWNTKMWISNDWSWLKLHNIWYYTTYLQGKKSKTIVVVCEWNKKRKGSTTDTQKKKWAVYICWGKATGAGLITVAAADVLVALPHCFIISKGKKNRRYDELQKTVKNISFNICVLMLAIKSFIV